MQLTKLIISVPKTSNFQRVLSFIQYSQICHIRGAENRLFFFSGNSNGYQRSSEIRNLHIYMLLLLHMQFRQICQISPIKRELLSGDIPILQRFRLLCQRIFHAIGLYTEIPQQKTAFQRRLLSKRQADTDGIFPLFQDWKFIQNKGFIQPKFFQPPADLTIGGNFPVRLCFRRQPDRQTQMYT